MWVLRSTTKILQSHTPGEVLMRKGTINITLLRIAGEIVKDILRRRVQQ